ncbi:T9SS type A sorting domain-containing protein [Pontibacter liquoris]|uniref:T9SS type A sorting domain-containing protein n=1 Tax=Pontibacter liquoris TaxID=2905677 RepID=UPI001FA6BFEC|nr:T9SS type A sorting domain-containing protein [Pontibacter liquoris]
MTILYAYLPGSARTRTRMLLAFLLLFLSSLAFANEGSQLVPLSLDERAQQSDIIVEGEVVSRQSFWDAGQKNIYTSNVINIYKVFKGKVQARQLEIITQGGAIGLKVHVASSALKLSKGEQGIFFLKKEQALRSTPAATLGLTAHTYGNQQGFVKYNVAQNTAADVFSAYPSVQALYKAITTRTGTAYRTITENEQLRKTQQSNAQQGQNGQLAPQAPVISDFSPTVATAGTNTVLTIRGSGFGSSRGKGTVEFRNADDGGKTFVTPLAGDYISWTNTEIKLRIPSAGADGGTAGSGEIRVTTAGDVTTSSGSVKLTLDFAYSNINVNGRAFKPALADKDGEGGYTIRFAPSMQNSNAAQEGFRRAMNTWVCTSKINWKIGAPTSVEKTDEDDMSIIRFVSNDVVGEGVLASTLSRYEGCLVGNDTIWWVAEFDMEINNSISWQYGPGGPENGQFDFQTVMLHELGHAHQLGHVILPRAVMHWAIAETAQVRDLSAADIAGANLVMSKTLAANPCGMQPMVPSSGAECNIAPEIYTFDVFFQEGEVTADWATRNEKSVTSFILQRSGDGSTWEDVSGQIAAKGPSAGDLNYTATDAEPLPRISYYRIRVIYSDGSESFSERFRIINPADIRQLSVYPNPVGPESNEVMLEYIVQSSTKVSIQLYTSSGKVVRDFDVRFTDINLPVKLDLKNLAAGLYIIKWKDAGGRTGERKLIKL